MKTIKQLEKEIEILIEETIKSNEKHFLNSNFDKENWRRISITYIKEGSEPISSKYDKLKENIKILAEVEKEIDESNPPEIYFESFEPEELIYYFKEYLKKLIRGK